MLLYYSYCVFPLFFFNIILPSVTPLFFLFVTLFVISVHYSVIVITVCCFIIALTVHYFVIIVTRFFVIIILSYFTSVIVVLLCYWYHMLWYYTVTLLMLSLRVIVNIVLCFCCCFFFSVWYLFLMQHLSVCPWAFVRIYLTSLSIYFIYLEASQLSFTQCGRSGSIL